MNDLNNLDDNITLELSSCNSTKKIANAFSSSVLINDKNCSFSNNTLTADRSLGSANKNRGRRVSFGAIHAIPTLENSTAASTSSIFLLINKKIK